jgi:hypothetical protein
MSTHATAHGQVRGSQKLLEGLAKNGEVPSIDQIKKALGFESIQGLQIPNWLTKGTPQNYLELSATIEVPIAQLNQVVNRFVQLNDSTIGFHILINGIPVPEIAIIQVNNTQQ